MGATIAVVIPTYNAEQYVCEALDSVAAQTRRPEQIIVVDDGSTDETVPRVKAWAAANRTGLELIEQANHGPSSARNAALRRAETELIALLDADDLFLPHHLELVGQAFARREDIVLAFGDAESFGAAGVVKTSLLAGTSLESLRYEEHPNGLRVLLDSAYVSLLRGSYVPVGATILRRAAVMKAGLYDEALRAEDRDLYLRLSRLGRFAYYPVVVERKRVHGENLTHPRNMDRYRRSQLLVLEKMLVMATELGLTADEVRQTREAVAEQVGIMLYHAAERGIGAYAEMCRFLWTRRVYRAMLTPRNWLRAAAFSTVLEKRFR